ncbi:hypothetical protein PF007_g40 [Phytophthora fragariae]|uniref:Uncharacterized protein n=2 Tax=Phytophthora fragariae TaxID=53985 RepID=A0A6A3TSI7_9STRA|nr:hypothetical protein PF007_g40 [Phytophthora fragariae]
MRMATRSRSDEEGNALLGGPSLVGSAIAVPQSFVAATASILEEGYQSKLKEASDQEQRKSRKALARRWSEPYSDDGSVDLLDATRLGLLVNYACIGFLNGLLPALVYPFFKLYLNMDGFQVSAAATVVRLPWSYKTLFGLLSDHLPIAGYRRKSYMLIGWIISIIALAVLAYNPIEAPYYKAGEIQRTREIELRVVENADAANSGGRYLLRLLVVCAGYVMTDVACDGVMVEMAQLEPMEVRGQAQATIYMVRYSASLMAGFVAALSFNGEVYGGTFSWSVAPNSVFWGCAGVAVVGCCGTLLFFDETRAGSSDTSKSKPILVTPLREMWRILQQRAIWQLVAFHFWHSFLTSVNFSDLAAIQEFWVGVTPMNNSLAGCVSTALVVFATFLMRECGRLFRSYELGRSNTARSAVTLRAVKLHIAELSAHTRGTARRRNGLRRSGTLNCPNGEDSSEEGVVGRWICPPSSEGAVHPSTCCCRNRPRRDRVVATYLRRPSRREHVSA